MTLTQQYRQTPEDIADLLAPYAKALTNASDLLSILTKTLGEAQTEQCAWPAYYGLRRAELSALAKSIRLSVDATRGRLTKNYVERYSRELGERVMAKYIDAEPEYLAVMGHLHQVEELLEKYDAVADAFTKRGYALRDLTTARVEKLDNLT